jgi:hypothetical protein
VVCALLAGVLLVGDDGANTRSTSLPAVGHLLVGAALPNNADPFRLEAAAGKEFGIRRTYWNASDLQDSVAVARDDVAAGRVPLLSYKVGGWKSAARGGKDAWARRAARELASVNGTVMVAIHHEPEGDGDIKAWTRMQQRLAPFFTSRPNIAFGLVLTGYGQLYGNVRFALDQLWPQDLVVDFLGFDIYQSYGSVDKVTGEGGTRWTDLDSAYFVKLGALARSRHVAWGLAETGLTDRAFADPRGRDWFSRTAEGVARNGGTFMSYFNSHQNSGANTWPLTGAKERAFLREVAAPPDLY